MNFKTTLVLLVLLAGVGAYFLLVERGREPGADTPAEVSEDGSAVVADAPERDAVRQVAVHRDDERVVLYREADAWWQVEPVRFAVNQTSGDQLVERALGLRWQQRFEPGADEQPTLADVGLDTPRAEVTLTAGEQAWTIRLGRRTIDGQAYVMLDGDDHVYITGDSLHQAVLDETIHDWRQKRLDSPRAAQANRVTLERAGETVELIKHDGRWYLDADRRERASQRQVGDYVGRVGAINIAAFVADAPDRLSAYGLHEPRLTLTLQTPAIDDEPGRTCTLRVGAAADLRDSQYYATWSVDDEMSPVVFTIDQRHLDRLAMNRDELRDPRIITASADDISELRVERPGLASLQLVRDADAGYRFGDDGPEYRVDYNTASELVESLVEVEATDYVADFDPPAGDPLATLTLTQRGKSERVRLYEGGRESADDDAADGESAASYLAVRDDESVAYRVSAERLAGLFAPLVAFRDLELINLPSDEIVGITLRRDDGAEFVFTREGDAWQLQGHGAFEQRTFEGLLGELRPLRATRWLDESVESGEGDGWAMLTVEQAGGSPYVLHVDVQNREGTFAAGDIGFELPSTFVERLRGEYRPRMVLSMSQGEIEQIRREHAGQTLTLRRTDAGEYLSDGDSPVNEQAAAALFDTLASLGVWRYIDEPSEPGDAPERQYVIERVDGEPYVLELWRPGGVRTVGRVGDRWFQLDAETLDVLYEPLLEDETPSTFEEVDDLPVRPVADPMK